MQNLFKSPFITGLTSLNILLPALLLFILVPHLSQVSLIISAYIVSILTLYTVHSLGIISQPGRLLRFILVIFALVILVMNYGIAFSQQASLSLLAIMLCLKLLEIRHDQDRRNIFIILFLAYFILIIHFLQSQTILLSLFILLNMVFLSLLLSAFNRKPQPPLTLKTNLALISRLLLKALPIAIILFLFFPRIPGPLWSLPDDGSSATTGISDKMFPGSVTELSDSDSIAFRVSFQGSPPPADKLYWRGPVLSRTDGFLWTQEKQQPLKHNLDNIITNQSAVVSYTITLEPHQQKWLFALEMPLQVSGDTINGHFLSRELQLLSKHNILQLTQYRISSATSFEFKPVSRSERLNALQYPQPSNPQTYQLGQKWQQQFNSDELIVAAGLNYFKEQPFYYTRKPDPMIDNPADQFLFAQRRGFCEHYASSFVLLMRAAGVPARVVTGYQGIEKNDVGNYYIVRQSNAHAWAEVLLENKGWLRVDPTGMIPPERIEADIFQTDLNQLRFSSLNLPALPQLTAQQKTALYRFYRQLQQSVDNLKNQWNNWVLGYDQNRQNLLLSLMGFEPDWQSLIYLLLSSMAGLMLLFYLITFIRNQHQSDPVYLYYQKLIDKFNRAGLSVQLNDGPESVRQQAIRCFPQQAQSISAIMYNYIQIRYADQADANLSRDFISAVKQLKIIKG